MDEPQDKTFQLKISESMVSLLTSEGAALICYRLLYSMLQIQARARALTDAPFHQPPSDPVSTTWDPFHLRQHEGQ